MDDLKLYGPVCKQNSEGKPKFSKNRPVWGYGHHGGRVSFRLRVLDGRFRGFRGLGFRVWGFRPHRLQSRVFLLAAAAGA